MAKKLTAFTSETCDTLRSEIDKAVETVATKFGISLKVGNIRYSDTTTTLKLEAAVEGAQQTEERSRWKQFATLYDLNPKWLDMTYTTGKGQVVKIVGLSDGRKPKVAVTVDGKSGYTAAVENIQIAMSANPKAALKKAQAAKNKASRETWKFNLSVYGRDYHYPAFGTKLTHQGTTYTVIGSKNGKYPIVAETKDGEVSFFPAEHLSVKAAMAA